MLFRFEFQRFERFTKSARKYERYIDHSLTADLKGTQYMSADREVISSQANPTLVTVTSILLPGTGQLLNRQVGKGLGLMALGLTLYVFAWPLALFLCAYSAWDAYDGANKINLEQIQRSIASTEIAAGYIATEDFVGQIEKLNNLANAGVLSAEELSNRKLTVINILKTKKSIDSTEDFLTGLIPLVQSGGLTQAEITEIKSLQT
jgi:hypothetical protein